MAEFPALPFFTDAYLGDTQHLTLEEHGAYLKLLMIAWRSPRCSIPNDDKRIATMLGIGAKRWSKIKPIIIEFFTERDGQFVQKRLLKERKWVEEKRNQQSQAGKRSALKRNETALTDVATNEPTGRATKKQLTHTHTLKPPVVPQGGSTPKMTFKQAMDCQDLEANCLGMAKRLFAEHGWPELAWSLLWEEFEAYWPGEGARKKKLDWPRAFYNRAVERRTWKAYAVDGPPTNGLDPDDAAARQRRARVRGFAAGHYGWKDDDDWGKPPTKAELARVGEH